VVHNTDLKVVILNLKPFTFVCCLKTCFLILRRSDSKTLTYVRIAKHYNSGYARCEEIDCQLHLEDNDATDKKRSHCWRLDQVTLVLQIVL
jgi:hypothetical protein